jgi:hypothetical protein
MAKKLNQVERIDQLIGALEAQIEIAKGMRSKELDLMGATDRSHKDDLRTEICFIHRLLGAGDTITHELIDMLMVD